MQILTVKKSETWIHGCNWKMCIELLWIFGYNSIKNSKRNDYDNNNNNNESSSCTISYRCYKLYIYLKKRSGGSCQSVR